MTPTKDPRELLSEVIRLIDADLKQIEGSSRWNAEPGGFSADLSRYATALLGISKDHEAAKDDAKKKYQKMTTEELVELAKRAAEVLSPTEGKKTDESGI